jgi:hypothetical protein
MASSSARVRIIFIIILLLSFSFIPGCIEMGDEDTDRDVVISPPTATSPTGPQPVFTPSGPAILPVPTPLPVGSVATAEPIPPAAAVTPFYRQHTADTAGLARPNEMPTATFFSGTYDLMYSNAALLVTVDRAPFVIEFWTSAYSNNPHFSLAVITIRDPATGATILEDGFNGQYSSEPYKRIIIRDSGQFHVNIYGMRTSVVIKLRGGVDESAAEPYGTTDIPDELRSGIL